MAKKRIWKTARVQCSQCKEYRHIRFCGGDPIKYAQVYEVEHKLCLSCYRSRPRRTTTRVRCVDCGELRDVSANHTVAPYEKRHPRCRACAAKITIPLQIETKRQKALERLKNNDFAKYTDGNGYVCLSSRVHPLKMGRGKNGRVLEHWHVMWRDDPEFTLWARENKWVIHHKNGVRDDNRIDNLEWRAPGKHPNGWTIKAMINALERAGYEVCGQNRR